MAAIVLVHGIAQEQEGADTLESAWLPAMAAGVRKAGNPDLADSLWRSAAPGASTVRMAYYGDLFVDRAAQGGTNALSPLETAIADELALAWLANASQFASDDRDRATAIQDLAMLDDTFNDSRQGRRHARPAMNALARLRWFAPAAVRVAGTLAYPALRQVSTYLANNDVRERAQARVHAMIGPETRLVVAHSLGTVVAYEALHFSRHPVALVTLGSPLGLRHVVYDRLRPRPPTVPECVTRWQNYFDLDDLIAAHTDLGKYFAPSVGRNAAVHSSVAVENGAHPHDARHYLTKRTVGEAVCSGLGLPWGQ